MCSGTNFVDGQKPSLSRIREHLYRVDWVDHFVMVAMVFHSCMFLPRELAIHDEPTHDICKQFGVRGDILLPLPQHVHDFIRGIKE